MKKNILILLICLIANGCLTGCMEGNIASQNQRNNNTGKVEMQYSFPEDAEIFFVDADDIYYFAYDQSELTADWQLIKFDRESNTNQILTLIPSVAGEVSQGVLVGDDIYFCYQTEQNKNCVMMVNSQTGESSAIYEWKGAPDFLYLYYLSTANSLVLFHIEQANSTVQYSVSRIDLTSFADEELLHQVYEDGKGMIISSVCTDGDYIYTFENTALENGQNAAYIVRYDKNGNEMNRYEPELDLFLHQDEYEDAVFDLYKFQDVFVLTTLNRRNLLFQEGEKGLTALKIPAELYENIPSEYHVISAPEKKEDALYFANPYRGKKSLIVWKNHKFQYMDIPFQGDGLRRFYLNANGDLLIQDLLIPTDHMETTKYSMTYFEKENMTFLDYEK